MTARPAEPVIRAHEMGIYKRYFDLITTGCKTTEIRVNDSSRRKIKESSLIRFRCQGDQVLTRVTRYDTFDEMFDHESVTSVNPLATRDEPFLRRLLIPRCIRRRGTRADTRATARPTPPTTRNPIHQDPRLRPQHR
jgi:ASC-1-like (ASCH) protein